MYMYVIGGVATTVTTILDPLLCGDSCVASSPSHALFFNVKDDARNTVAREPFVYQHYYLGELTNCSYVVWDHSRLCTDAIACISTI